MSDHADIVREALDYSKRVWDNTDDDRYCNAALAALDALVAERDEARKAYDAALHGTAFEWRVRAEAAEEMAKQNACDWADMKERAEAAEAVAADREDAAQHAIRARVAAEAERDDLRAKYENAAYDASRWERNCMDEINRAEDFQAEAARLREALTEARNWIADDDPGEADTGGFHSSLMTMIDAALEGGT